MENTLERQLKYHSWAMDILFNHLGAQPELPPDCLKLLQHIVNAESIWTSRVFGETPLVGVWEERPLPDCLKLHQESAAKLAALIRNEADLDRAVSYVNSQGKAFTNSVHDIVIHLLNHGTYHRAQIAKGLRTHSLEPVNTDYITYARSKSIDL